jgi:protein-disulfide isomerase
MALACLPASACDSQRAAERASAPGRSGQTSPMETTRNEFVTMNIARVPLRTAATAAPRPQTPPTPESPRLAVQGLAPDHGTASPLPPPVSNDDATAGERDARVAAIVFGDLECPFTARTVTVLRSLQEAYGRAMLRLVWKHRILDFHRRARPAARSAQAVFLLAGGDAFWRFLDDATGESSRLADRDLAAWAENAGASASSYAWLTRDGTSELDEKLDADARLAEQQSVRSVPVVWIGAQRFDGAQRREVYAAALDDQLSGGGPRQGGLR